MDTASDRQLTPSARLRPRSPRYWLNLLSFTVAVLLAAIYIVLPIAGAYLFTQPQPSQVDEPTPPVWAWRMKKQKISRPTA